MTDTDAQPTPLILCLPGMPAAWVAARLPRWGLDIRDIPGASDLIAPTGGQHVLVAYPDLMTVLQRDMAQGIPPGRSIVNWVDLMQAVMPFQRRQRRQIRLLSGSGLTCRQTHADLGRWLGLDQPIITTDPIHGDIPGPDPEPNPIFEVLAMAAMQLQPDLAGLLAEIRAATFAPAENQTNLGLADQAFELWSQTRAGQHGTTRQINALQSQAETLQRMLEATSRDGLAKVQLAEQATAMMQGRLDAAEERIAALQADLKKARGRINRLSDRADADARDLG